MLLFVIGIYATLTFHCLEMLLILCMLKALHSDWLIFARPTRVL